jgi:M6 family metalloprotease-like protein
MKFNITKILLLISLLFLSFGSDLYSVSLTPEVVEKLRNEGRLEEWVKRWRSAAERRTYEITPDTPIRSEKKRFGDVDTLRPLVLCVDFSDNESTYTTGAFDTLLFSRDFTVPTGSFRDYYLEVSYGQHDANGGVYGWVRAPQTYDYYSWGLNGIDGPPPHNAQQLVEDALLAADDFVDYSDYDHDENGWIDGLIVVHAGPGAEQTGDDWDIWSHRWSLDHMMTLDGIKIYSYTMQPEEDYPSGDLITIGVFCHEWGHFLGINWEEYDEDYSSEGLGGWSVMARGCFNNNGRTPAHHSAYCKYYLGWGDVIQVQPNQANVEILQAETSPVSYRLWTSGASGSQYFLVENRQKTGFDSRLPGGGLLIYHVDASKPSNDLEWCPDSLPSRHYKVALEQADGLFQLEGCDGFPNEGNSGDPFPGSSNKRAFDDTTTPSSSDYYDNPTQVAVWNISDSDSAMYANLDVTWSRPCLFLNDFTLDDLLGGDGDGRAEAGETVRLYCTISNIWLPLNGATVTASADTTGIDFTHPTSNLGDIGTGGSADNNSDPIVFDVDSLFPGRPTIFTLRVEGNSGSYTYDFNVEVRVGSAKILIVDDDSGSAKDYQQYYTDALDYLRTIYDIWDTEGKGDPDFSFNKYEYLIWYTGDHKTDIFTQAQVESLMSFLDHGGSLFLTSQDAAEVLSSSANPLFQEFLTDYLHCSLADDSCTKRLVLGETEDPVGDSSYIHLWGSSSPQNQTSKDVLLPDGFAVPVLKYAKNSPPWDPVDSIAGIRYHGDNYRLVFFGFGFEGMDTSGGLAYGQYLSKPHLVMQRVLDYLQGVTDILDFEEDYTSIPKSIELFQNYPNPFNPNTSIQFTVNSGQSPIYTTHEKGVDGSRLIVHSPVHTTLKIYNIRGQVVRTLVDEDKAGGDYTVFWNGRDEYGKAVSSGIYFYKLTAGSSSEVKKMVLLK